MKKRYRTFIFVLILVLLIFAGCKKKINDNPGDGGHQTPPAVKEYEINLSLSTITITVAQVETFDFKSLFEVKENNKVIKITDDMVTSNVTSFIGEYTYVVKVGDKTQTLYVNVVDEPKEIKINAKKNNITIKDSDAEKYDFKSLFTITVNDEEIPVLNEYLNLTTDFIKPGKHTLICSYLGKNASIDVTITETIYELELSVSEITINASLAFSYDYKSLFTYKIDGKIVEISNEMIQNNVQSDEGTYTFTVTAHGITKTLTVTITNDHTIEIVKSYQEIEISIDEIKDFDYTTLFSLYVDGKSIQVTLNMLDTSNLNNATINQKVEVTLTHQVEKTTKSESIWIVVVPASQIIINAKDLVIYPNSEHIDLTTLFSISKGNDTINVTPDMISGSINYEQDGVYPITINYQNISKNAIVEVRRGVIIEAADSDTITIIKGTNQATYSFISDFKVMINGIYFNSIPDNYISENNADFNTVGEYSVTLKIPYNDKRLGLSGVKFSYYEKTIHYLVVDNKHTLNVKQDIVILPLGTTDYNVYSNFVVTINGRKQTLTEVKEYVDPITCYVKTISNPIDFTSIGRQEVKVEIYVNGINSSPVVAAYYVIIQSNVIVTSINKIIFTGDTLYARDLFTILKDDQNIEVTNDMISGKIDNFNPGVYQITINYMGIIEYSKVVVYDSSIKGIYHTDLTTIPEQEEPDEDYSEGYYDELSSENTPISKSVQTKLQDLIISSDGEITINGVKAKILDGINEHTMLVKFNNYEHTLYINNGIIVIDPDNAIKLGFSDYKRPLVYFSENLWDIENKFVINSTSKHVLENTVIAYSIDVFNLKSKVDGSKLSYALKIQLVEKTSSDTVYQVTWDKAIFDDNFENKIGIVSTITFKNQIYKFSVEALGVGRIYKNEEKRLFANMTFVGTIDGKYAELRADQYEAFSLYIEGKRVLSLAYMEIESLVNGGVDYNNNIVFLYENRGTPFSYKFSVNPLTKTFDLMQRDQYYGKYVYNDKYIFIDGYGTGVISFDAKSYHVTKFTYDVYNNYITFTYHDTLPTFSYGEGGKAYIEPLLNVLTIKEIGDSKLQGVQFENISINDGAIVHINSLKIGQNSSTVAKKMLYENIEIITKDGPMDDDQKAECINTSSIQFNTPGFYQFTVSLKVGENEIISYYAIQIIESIYKENPVIGTYGEGVIFNANRLSIDQYGQVIIDSNEVRFEGMIKINDDLTFNSKLYSKDGKSIIMTGRYISEGLILVNCTGATSFQDYFTKGSTKISGTDNFVIRAITIGSNTTFIYSNSISNIGNFIAVESINGTSPISIDTILKMEINDEIKYIKIISWDDAKKGLMIADVYRGTYFKDGSSNIIVDGFGNASVGQVTGTYTLNKNNMTFSTDSFVKVYSLNNIEYTYEEVQISLDNSLVKGKTFSASYTFICDGYPYVANTSFKFGDNGVVTIISNSPTHDDGSEACESDTYSPIFASKNGTKGTYSVSGNKLTIKVNEITFVFVIDDVMTVSTFTCVSTTLDSETHGYFATNTIFMVV